ncbi:uncharacterized protein [Aegilops tauschii subsp. strangulata]|uniref:C2 domain-containing protein n=1 Tax=Aegilops tauschii subsp. strangulata TaxID=200361 RepID=A0A453GYY1_AEGTS|nr:spidroin-1 [Aegilops tauschii subsp. strangulata]
MGSRYEVEVTVGSARDLKNVNWRNGDLKPYAVLWIDAGARCSTRVDLDNGDNPSWDEKVVVPLPPASRLEDAVLYIDVVHANAAEGVKPLVGSARLPLRDVVDDAGVGGKVSRNLRLKRPSGRPQGKLDVRVAVKEPARYYDSNVPGGYPAPAGYGSSRDAYGGGYGAGAGPYGAAAGAGGYGAYAAAAPPSGYPGYGSTAPPPQAAAAPYGAAPPPYGAAPPTQGAGGYGSSVQPAYGAAPPTQGAGGYGSSAQPAYGGAQPGQAAGYGGTTGVGLDQSGGKTKKKGMGMAGGLAVGAAAGVLGGLALAGGASYVEHKIEDHVTERVEEDMYRGGGYDDYGGDDDY